MNRSFGSMIVVVCLALGAACSNEAPEAVPTTSATSSAGLGALLPFPPELLPGGCAAEKDRDLAVFEAAVSAEPTLEALCAIVGPPDWVTGSGLMIVVFDLGDGIQVLVSYGGVGEPLLGASWMSPTGESRPLGGA